MSEAGKGRIDAAWYDRSDYFTGGTDHLTDMHSRFQRYRVRMVSELARPRPDDVVADLGCGWGTFEFALADRVAHVTGIDFSERSIELCRERLAEDPRDNVAFRQMDAPPGAHPGDPQEQLDPPEARSGPRRLQVDGPHEGAPDGCRFPDRTGLLAHSHLPGFNLLERALQPMLPWFRRRIAMLGVRPT